MGSTCAVCSRPVPDVAYVGPCCERALAAALRAAADLLPALDDAVAKLVRFATPGPRARGHAPAQPIRPGDPTPDQVSGYPTGLVVDLRASEVRDAIANVVGTWCRVVVEERGPVAGNLAGLAEAMRWLAGQLGWMRYQSWAGEAWDELTYAAGQVERAVDRPAERRWLGPCQEPDGLGGACPGQLSARAGASHTRCPACGTSHEVATRRDWLAGLVMERAYTAAEIGDAYGHVVKADRIRQWAARGQLANHGADRHGRALYSLREVLDLAAEMDTKSRRKRERMAA